MARVFVSSTFKDLEECREKVRIVLRRMGHEDVAMEYFVAEDKRPLDKCLSAVVSSDLYIGIFAWRYGYIPDGYEKSMTELEYQKAVETGKDCLIFLLHEDAPWPRKFIDKGENLDKIEALRSNFSTEYLAGFFTTSDDLVGLVSSAVHKWEIESRNSPEEKKIIAHLDLTQYREAVSKRYCNIDLDALTPSKKEDYIKVQLSSVFVEQNVKENPPPVDLPKEIWNKMHEEWYPEKECFLEDLTAEDLKHTKESYYSKGSKAVLDVISDKKNKYIVVLGDPGSGKSTLAKYVILSVLQINDDEKLSKFFYSYLPLIVELREFAGLCKEKECDTFLDYFQQLAETEGYSLTKEKVANYLKNDGKAIIIFDGLDEIFDIKEWERINHMIVKFTLDYPKVRIIVTSRIVGYKRKILDDAGFAHFILQDFEKKQIEIFLDKWYPFVVDEKEIESRKSRILKALKDSPSIRQLAGDPLLLTILAIIGKHQELPRERWKLYDHAASVLIENWEVNKHLKRSSVYMDFIGEDDKKELLMKIAFRMQSSPEGLSGNFIHKNTLQKEIEVYLQNRYQENLYEAKLTAEAIIDQLRRVNFILCLYGADFYGFVNSAFLEYFCAMYIVQKFDNHELNIETLKSNYFEKYWEDPTWHEILSLVCGMKEKFARDIIECLMQVYDPQFLGNRPPLNISLAIKCLSELQNPNVIEETKNKLLERVLKLFEMVSWIQDLKEFLVDEIVPAAKFVQMKNVSEPTPVAKLIQVKNVSELRVDDNLSIETRFVSKREKEIVRIAAVQLNFKLSDIGFPPQIIDKERSKDKILRALEIAINEEADIICLPELCVCEDWIPEIKDVCSDIALIAGSYYDAEKHNACKPLLNSGADVPLQIKITPSPFEEAGIVNKKMMPGDKIHIYDTNVGKFSVLICRDFINLRHYLRGKTDILFVPSYNEKIERFHEDANNHVTNSPGYIVISNTSLYGGTSVFGIIRKEFNNDLIEAGYKVEGDEMYKLCELKKGEEGMIIGDFNLIHKSIQVPAPANPAEEIRPVSRVYKKLIEF